MSRTRYDHFHCIFKLPDGTTTEIEGGLSGLPDEFESWSAEQRMAWRRDLAVAWGMPAEAEIAKFWVAG